MPLLAPPRRILEIGAGTGEQARALADRGFEVTAVEIASSRYATERAFPIVDYDGRTLPIPDRSVDIVFSSNVLEHVSDLAVAGYPDAILQLLSLVTFRRPLEKLGNVVSRLFPRRHGERGNAFSELHSFRPAWWRAHFAKHAFTVERDEPMGMFYSGHMVFGTRLGVAARRKLARMLGSSCHVFILK